MSTLQCRGLIALATVAVALLSSRPANAQLFGPPRQPGGFLDEIATGVAYDRVNQAKAEKHLLYRQEKLRRDAERGHTAAAERDVRRIQNLQYRIVVDEWLIRQNSLQDPGYYPYPLRLDPISCAALANVRRPQEVPTPLQVYPEPKMTVFPVLTGPRMPGLPSNPTGSPMPSTSPVTPLPSYNPPK